MMIKITAFSWVAVFLMSGCASQPVAPRHASAEFRPPRAMLEAYDANRDGTITRGEMEDGLRSEFAKADARHAGCLDADEVRAVNQERWERDQSTYSPLLDLKGDGCIDFDEFAATVRSLFEQMDTNGDEKISPRELRPARRPSQDR